MEIDEINYGIESQFHMLRHFESPSDELKQQLINSGYSMIQIESELNEPGSRFWRSFATDISSLLDKAFACGFSTQIGSNGNIILNGRAKKEDYSLGIGTKSVISIEDLEELNRSRIFIKKNRGTDLLHFEVETLPTTLEFTIILKKTSTSYIFITAFSGEPAMPLPSYDMPNELRKQCQDYWATHVFLVKSNSC